MPALTHSLPYGTGHLSFEAAEERFESLRADPGTPLLPREVTATLVDPVAGPSLDRVVGKGDDCLIVFSDASRKTCSEYILPPLLERLGKIGAGRVRGLVATGTHRAVSDEELDILMGRAAGAIEVLQHDCRAEDLHVCEPTRRGTEVHLHPALFEADRVIAVGGVTFHYHAGFTGGRKSIFPGLGGARGILRSHLRSLTWPGLERHPGARPGNLEGNPVHDDLMEAASRREPDYVVNLVPDARGRPVAGAGGPMREAHLAASRACGEMGTVPIGGLRPLVVASAGGHPKDRDLVQAHKAMDHSSMALDEGGVLVLAAALPEGYGSEGIREWLALGSPEAVRERLRSVLGDTVPAGEEGPPSPTGEIPGVYAQTALLLLEKARRFRVLLVTEMEPAGVEALGIEPVADLEAALARAREILGEDAPGYLVRQGAAVLPVLD